MTGVTFHGVKEYSEWQVKGGLIKLLTSAPLMFKTMRKQNMLNLFGYPARFLAWQSRSSYSLLQQNLSN